MKKIKDIILKNPVTSTDMALFISKNNPSCGVRFLVNYKIYDSFIDKITIEPFFIRKKGIRKIYKFK